MSDGDPPPRTKESSVIVHTLDVRNTEHCVWKLSMVLVRVVVKFTPWGRVLKKEVDRANLTPTLKPLASSCQDLEKNWRVGNYFFTSEFEVIKMYGKSPLSVPPRSYYLITYTRGSHDHDRKFWSSTLQLTDVFVRIMQEGLHFSRSDMVAPKAAGLIHLMDTMDAFENPAERRVVEVTSGGDMRLILQFILSLKLAGRHTSHGEK
ncbi:hypothetical protein DEU56DRAFT_752384 [Suillus clintonianus]|uniref:uncharacterized protein n=1 Tax=Suillus clintonianus TaxID=1904413 RepID=UPI001B874A8A|nr:uncharacterized protein DEU56DRAFT_752384 [Suillus clintonianus]KAG2151489.1 hypothetical protein DEU56DRAFT_752384 [Suillus clintonianus]